MKTLLHVVFFLEACSLTPSYASSERFNGSCEHLLSVQTQAEIWYDSRNLLSDFNASRVYFSVWLPDFAEQLKIQGLYNGEAFDGVDWAGFRLNRQKFLEIFPVIQDLNFPVDYEFVLDPFLVLTGSHAALDFERKWILVPQSLWHEKKLNSEEILSLVHERVHLAFRNPLRTTYDWRFGLVFAIRLNSPLRNELVRALEFYADNSFAIEEIFTFMVTGLFNWHYACQSGNKHFLFKAQDHLGRSFGFLHSYVNVLGPRVLQLDPRDVRVRSGNGFTYFTSVHFDFGLSVGHFDKMKPEDALFKVQRLVLLERDFLVRLHSLYSDLGYGISEDGGVELNRTSLWQCRERLPLIEILGEILPHLHIGALK